MNKKFYGLISALLVVIGCYSQPSPPEAVNIFYGGMKKLAAAPNNQSAEDILSSMRKCFFEPMNSGIDIPNDFRFFDYDKRSFTHTDLMQSTKNYIDKLDNYIYKDKVMSVKYEVMKNEIGGTAPDFSSRKLSEEVSHTITIIKKTFTIGNQTKTFNDTITTYLQSGLIGEICNGFGTSNVDINTLRIRAERAYFRKSYYEAYKCYEQILELDNKDKDTYYRLGLMTFWLQGCDHKFSKKKYAKKKGKEYLTIAKGLGHAKADIVLHNLYYTNP